MERPYRYRILILRTAAVLNAIAGVVAVLVALVGLFEGGSVGALLFGAYGLVQAVALCIVFWHVADFFRFQSADALWRTGYCAECGYHLAGVPEAVTCPECGTAIPQND